MIENRPIVAIAIGYILGIIMGLYCKISIVFLYLILISAYFIYSKLRKPNNIFKLISFKRYFRYVKLVISKKVFLIIIISALISNTIILYKNNEYKNIYDNFDSKEINLQATVVSNSKEKKYSNLYKIKSGNKSFYLNTKKKVDLKYGDIIKLQGIFKKPKVRTNYKGFDYGQYLKTLGIYGTIEEKSIQKIGESKFSILKNFNYVFLNIKDAIEKEFDKDTSSIILGITLGYTDGIDEDIKADFVDSNISHILAVSGMHVSYILFACSYIFENVLGKRKGYIFSILFCIFYMLITGMSPSVVRAVIMAVLLLFSKIIYKKSDIWTNISISALVLLIYNPYLLQSAGFILSFSGTIGIIIYSKSFKRKNKLLDLIGITIIVTIINVPFVSLFFNKIPIFSLIISAIIGFVVAPIMILNFIFILLPFGKFFLKPIIDILVKILLKLANIGSDLPLGKSYIITPNVISILLHFVLFFLIILVISAYKLKNKNKAFYIRIKNLIQLLKYRLNQNKRKIISILLIFIIFISIFKFIPKNLKIYFIDVGQGDSCLIVTPSNRSILIDGGGSENFDVGKNTLLPYLLSRGIMSVDYIIISHFDTDHVGGLLTVIEELKVGTVIISKQGEDSENLKKFNSIVSKRKIHVNLVQAGDRVNIEKNIFFDILWPDNSNLVSENILNNNSIVCKMNYKNFSMLFTGDIEEIAEKAIIQEYKDSDILNSTVLKVGHHGSKSSSIQKFIESVKPKIALIGVGENNTFGHPNDEVLKRLENVRCKKL